MPLLFQFARLIEIKGSDNDYVGGYQVLIHPPDVDIDSAMLSYPNFIVDQGDFREIKLSKVNIFSLTSKENPCFDDDALFGTACAVEEVKMIIHIGK